MSSDLLHEEIERLAADNARLRANVDRLTDERSQARGERDAAINARNEQLEPLTKDNARLRALIKEVEAHAVDGEDSEQSTGVCPWCGAWRMDVGVASFQPRPHSIACPAFTPEGAVR